MGGYGDAALGRVGGVGGRADGLDAAGISFHALHARWASTTKVEVMTDAFP